MATNVPSIILSQLGGNRFIAMTGAQVSGEGNRLIIKLPRSLVVTVDLMPSDTYAMKVGKRASMNQLFKGKPAVTWTKESDGIYFDGLQDEFTRLTGLYTRL